MCLYGLLLDLKGYRCFDLILKIFFVSIDVTFFEQQIFVVVPTHLKVLLCYHMAYVRSSAVSCRDESLATA